MFLTGLAAADVVAVNETELGALTGLTVAPDAPAADMVAAADKLRRIDQTVIVTLGSRGAIAAGPLGVQEIPGLPVRAVDATGAGDCFVGALCARLAAGDALPGALVWANTAASLCVQRPGAGPSMPTAGEVSAAISSPPG